MDQTNQPLGNEKDKTEKIEEKLEATDLTKIPTEPEITEEKAGFVRKTISIKEDQAKFIEENSINLSRLTQRAIKIIMKKFQIENHSK